LEIYPEKERLEAVKLTDVAGDSVLHYAAQNPNPESLRAILEIYPEKERLEAVKLTDRFGNTVLHHAAKNPESLKAIEDLLPKEVPSSNLSVLSMFKSSSEPKDSNENVNANLKDPPHF
jgi:hypothetical protein